MKTTYLFFCLIAGGLVFSLRANAEILEAVEDATIRLNNPDINYGDETEIHAANFEGKKSLVYLKFDASKLNGKVTSVEGIEAYALPQRRPRNSQVFLLLDEKNGSSWTEDSINWDNAPGNNLSDQRLVKGEGLLLGHLEKAATDVASSVDISWSEEDADSAKEALIGALNQGDRVVTLVLVRPSDREAVYTSKENAAPAAHPVRILVETSE